MAKKDLPSRGTADNKTRGGKCLILAGSAGMWGACILAAQAAARSGAGYVYIDGAKNFPAFGFPDFLTKIKKQKISDFRAVAVGPGLRVDSALQKKLRALSKIHRHVVVDASALTALSAMKRIHLPPTWILTPHEGELARLKGVTSEAIRAHREKFARAAQEKFGCIILLKGHGTLIATSEDLWRIPTGNAALAKAGTGDVLTGMIAGLLSQGLEPEKAAALAAYVHGDMADQWLKKGNDILSLMASDLVAELPKALARLRNSKPR